MHSVALESLKQGVYGTIIHVVDFYNPISVQRTTANGAKSS